MKKFTAIALILVLAFTLVACSGAGSTTPGDTTSEVGETSAKILAMYSRKSPTKSVTVATYSFLDTTLQDVTTLISGKVDGTKDAAELTQITERLRTVADGSNASILGPIERTKTVKEFYEGRGVRTQINDGNWGSWDVTAENFAPAEGSLTLNLSDSKITGIKEEGKTITFTVPAANTESVLGKAIASNVVVSLVHDGACVVGITLDYTEAKTANTPEISVKIKVDYSYDIENITIG